MQRKVLESLYRQGGLTLFAIADVDEMPTEALQKFALALNAGARFIVLDFSGRLALDGNAPFQTLDLSKKILSDSDIEEITGVTAVDGHATFAGAKAIPSSDSEYRTLYHNIKKLETVAPQILGIISADTNAYISGFSHRRTIFHIYEFEFIRDSLMCKHPISEFLIKPDIIQTSGACEQLISVIGVAVLDLSQKTCCISFVSVTGIYHKLADI